MHQVTFTRIYTWGRGQESLGTQYGKSEILNCVSHPDEILIVGWKMLGPIPMLLFWIKDLGHLRLNYNNKKQSKFWSARNFWILAKFFLYFWYSAYSSIEPQFGVERFQNPCLSDNDCLSSFVGITELSITWNGISKNWYTCFGNVGYCYRIKGS